MAGIVRRDIRFIVVIREDYKSKHTRMQRQHFLLGYFKTLSDGSAPEPKWLTTSRVAARCSTNRATGARRNMNMFLM